MAESSPPRAAESSRSEARLAERMIPWVLLAGVMTRAIHYFGNRSLWLDEAMVALNIERRGFGELLGSLDFNQAAPLGFLWLEKLAVLALGVNERALRLWPYLAAVAALFVFATLARRLIRPGAALFAVLAFALSGSLVYYAAEVKQYAFDVLCAATLIWLTARSVDRGSWTPVVAAGAIGVWLSHPLVFVLPGALLVLWLQSRDAGEPARRALIGTAVLWTASFAAAFWLTARGASQSPVMARFWLEGFMPVPPTTVAELGWFADAASGWLRNALDFAESVSPARTMALVAGGALAVTGIARAWRTDRRALLLVGAPILLALGASAVQAYPFKGRLILFLVPSTLLLLGWGVEAGLSASRAIKVPVAAAAVAWLLGSGAVLLEWLRAPYREELRPALEVVAARLEPGDRVYLHSGAQHAQLFYERTCETCRLEPATVIRGGFLAGRPEGIRAEVEGLATPGRLWAVFAHEWWGYGDAERDEIVAALRARSTRVETWDAPGAEAYLFELGR